MHQFHEVGTEVDKKFQVLQFRLETQVGLG